MNSQNEYEVIKQSLLASPLFDVIKISDRQLIATRLRSIVPRRGIFRLLIPHTYIVINAKKTQGSTISVRPDPVAIFMMVMILGGVLGEVFMDRSQYPRDYPPEFIYGLAIFYIGWLIIEMFSTRRQIRALFGQGMP